MREPFLYVQLHERFPEHKKVDALSDPAFRLLTSAICYAHADKSDGLILPDRVPRLVPRYRKRTLDELVERGWFEPLGDPRQPEAYLIHDYLDWNPSRAEVEERRATRSAAGAKGAEQRWGTR